MDPEARGPRRVVGEPGADAPGAEQVVQVGLARRREQTIYTAKIGRASLYRRWSAKSDLVADAVAQAAYSSTRRLGSPASGTT
jgi:hypothetical protein